MTALLASIGWRHTFELVAAITVFVVAPLIYVVLRVRPDPGPRRSGDAAAAAPPQAAWTTRTIVGNRNFWILIAVFVPVGVFYSGTQFHLGAFAQDIGLAQERAALVVSFLSVVMIFSKVMLGQLADRCDLRWLCALVLGFAVLAVTGFAFASSLAGVLGAALCLGIANGGYLPIMAAVVSTRFGTASFGQVMGMLMIFANFASLAAIVTGWIRESAGSYTVAFLSLIVVALPGLLAFRFLQQKAVAPAAAAGT